MGARLILRHAHSNWRLARESSELSTDCRDVASYVSTDGQRLFGQLEVHAAVVVRFLGGRDIQIGERNLPGPLLSEDPKCLPHDGIVLDFLGMLVTENKLGQLRLSLRCMGWPRFPCFPLLAQAVYFILQAINLRLLSVVIDVCSRIIGGWIVLIRIRGVG